MFNACFKHGPRCVHIVPERCKARSKHATKYSNHAKRLSPHALHGWDLSLKMHPAVVTPTCLEVGPNMAQKWITTGSKHVPSLSLQKNSNTRDARQALTQGSPIAVPHALAPPGALVPRGPFLLLSFCNVAVPLRLYALLCSLWPVFLRPDRSSGGRRCCSTRRTLLIIGAARASGSTPATLTCQI